MNTEECNKMIKVLESRMNKYRDSLYDMQSNAKFRNCLSVIEKISDTGLRGTVVKLDKYGNPSLFLGHNTICKIGSIMIDILYNEGEEYCCMRLLDYMDDIPKIGINNKINSMYYFIIRNCTEYIRPDTKLLILSSMNYMYDKLMCKQIIAEKNKLKRLNKPNKYKQLEFNLN